MDTFSSAQVMELTTIIKGSDADVTYLKLLLKRQYSKVASGWNCIIK
jgi:hypothetical protein